MNNLIEIKNLSVSFNSQRNQRPVVNSISFNIPKGKTVALVGESGSGKTLTALSILKLLPYPNAFHDSGQILFENKNILEITNDEIKKIRGNKITTIFQEPMSSLNPLHTIEKQINEIIMLHSKTTFSMATKKTKILVCGATGFIGRNYVERLLTQKNTEVIGVYHTREPYDAPGLKWVYADLRQPDQVNKILPDVDIIVQAAAITSGSKDVVERPYIHIADNVVMNSYLMRGALDHRIQQFILFSCTVMYHSQDTPHTETSFDPSRPITPAYFAGAWNKIYLEKMAEFYSALDTTRYTAIRHSNIFGPYDKYDLDHSHVFGATVTKVMTAKEKLIVWGEGKEKRDFLYVDDLLDFIDLAISLQKKQFEIYCCGSGKGVSVNELVSKMLQHSGRDIMVEHDLSKPSIPVEIVLDCSKAQLELNWAPKLDLDKGVKKTFDWWQHNVKYL